MPEKLHPNLSILTQLDIADVESCAEIFASNFVWHYFNSKRPEFEGTFHGVTGLKNFFAKMKESSNGAFHVNPV